MGTGRQALRLVAALLLAVTSAACHRSDDTRIPPFDVNLSFSKDMWDTYGLESAAHYERFILTV